MICPRCQQENPVGRGFCIRCAYPLPEERQTEQTPAYEPINFDQPVPVRNESPLNPQPRRRPVVLGIVGLVMGGIALLMALYGVVFLASKDNLSEMLGGFLGTSAGEIDETVMAGIYGIVAGVYGIILGVLAVIFGRRAMRRLNAEPACYMGGGMYRAAFILGIVSLAVSAVCIAAGVVLLR